MIKISSVAILLTLLLAAPALTPPNAAAISSTFLAAMAREAQAAGVSPRVIDTAFAGVTPDPAVLAFDRRQRGTFRKSFEDYAAHPRHRRRASTARKQLMQRARRAARRASSGSSACRPRCIDGDLDAWRRDNGTGDMGKLPVIRTLATLAHDCRRTELFQGELIAALQDRAARRPAACAT